MFDDEIDPYPAYLVQYLVQVVDNEQRRPTCIINARYSRVIMSWDALETCVDCEATGIGGNEKIGKIRYGELQRCLDLRRENGVCYLENKYVRVINNNFTYLSKNEESEYIGVASYNCEEIDDDVNGAYSPLLDALFYGTVVGKMYEDWYNMTPLGDRMTFRVHFGANFSNALWNGFECAFGDGGYTYMYPLVSLDVVGHEVGHGITEKNSELYYYEQWGGINEAFSDMAGETAEAYLDEADWVMGVDITYKGAPPLRFFENPETDNMSISHVDNYTAFLNPHFGSGVYNRVFYILVQEYGLHIKDVFGVFLHANRMYWHHMANYFRAACDVMKAAYDLGQDGSKFRKAFGEVGITVCDVEDHVLGLKSGENYTNIKVAKDISPTFFFGVPGQYAASVEVSARSAQGDVNIVVSNKTWGDEESNVRMYAEGLGLVRFDVPDNSSMLVSITLSTDSATPLTNVTLMALFTCVRNFSYNGTGVGYLYWYWDECTVYEEEEGEGEEVEEDTDSPGEESSDKIEKGEVKAEFANQTHISASGHVFNFFKSFVIMVFPKNK